MASWANATNIPVGRCSKRIPKWPIAGFLTDIQKRHCAIYCIRYLEFYCYPLSCVVFSYVGAALSFTIILSKLSPVLLRMYPPCYNFLRSIWRVESAVPYKLISGAGFLRSLYDSWWWSAPFVQLFPIIESFAAFQGSSPLIIRLKLLVVADIFFYSVFYAWKRRFYRFQCQTFSCVSLLRSSSKLEFPTANFFS